jgi:hypothetical protein
MATPNLDILSVQLAELLGDPYDEDGAAVTASTDGITYSSARRDQYITEALRELLNTLGHDFLEFSGFAANYTTAVEMTSNDHDVPDTASRVFMVTWRGERLCFTPLADQAKFNNILTDMNTPKWRVINGAVHIYNFPESPWPSDEVYMHTLDKVPQLSQGGSDDVEIDSYFWPLLLRYAEVIGRRNHQETQQFVAVKQKENDDRTVRIVNTEGEKWH